MKIILIATCALLIGVVVGILGTVVIEKVWVQADFGMYISKLLTDSGHQTLADLWLMLLNRLMRVVQAAAIGMLIGVIVKKNWLMFSIFVVVGMVITPEVLLWAIGLSPLIDDFETIALTDAVKLFFGIIIVGCAWWVHRSRTKKKRGLAMSTEKTVDYFSGLVHDLYFDIDKVMLDSDTHDVVIPLSRTSQEAPFMRLTIHGVTGVDVKDTERVKYYDIYGLKYEPQKHRLILKGNMPILVGFQLCSEPLLKLESISNIPNNS